MSARVTPLAATGIVVAALGVAALGAVGARDHARGGTPETRREANEIDRRAADAGRRRESAAARALRQGRPIDINTSSASDLQLLPGIGPALSKRIVRARGDGGAFGSVDELQRVSGIGPKTVEHLRSLVHVAEGRGDARSRDGGTR